MRNGANGCRRKSNPHRSCGTVDQGCVCRWTKDHVFSAEAVGLEPTSGFQAVTCFQDRLLIRPDGFRVKLRRLESNQHEDVQNVSSYR